MRGTALYGCSCGRDDARVLRPRFRDAYLVDHPLENGYVGVVRRDRAVWRIYRLDGGPVGPSGESFATREDAGRRLLELAAERPERRK